MEPMTLELRPTDGEPKILFTKGIPSVEEVDALIQWLGNMRSRIEPEVPMELPKGLQLPVQIEEEPAAEVAGELDGSSLLLVRHAGYGWLGFRFRDASRQWLIDALIADEEKSQAQGSSH